MAHPLVVRYPVIAYKLPIRSLPRVLTVAGFVGPFGARGLSTNLMS